jgi:dienelactone hydrolase
LSRTTDVLNWSLCLRRKCEGAAIISPGHEWNAWSDSPDLSAQLTKLLGAAQEGGSTVSECFLTASRIDPSDEESWHREWSRTADVSIGRANAALARGNLLTAKSNWLRAISYLNAAVFDLDFGDGRLLEALAGMRACARQYLAQHTPAGEVASIPWLTDYPLQGYYLRPSSAAAQTPVVICIGEPGHRKEEFLFKMERYARDRAMSLLAIDLLGTEIGGQFERIVGRADLETAIGAVVDYLVARPDVDSSQIAIIGDGSSSSFVARGAALDDRLAAAVCDAGIWDLQERTFLASRISPPDAPIAIRPGRVVRNLNFPVLITIGEDGWLERDRVIALVEQLRKDKRNIALKIFSRGETSAMQGHEDNPTLANEFIFDWVGDCFSSQKQTSATIEPDFTPVRAAMGR